MDGLGALARRIARFPHAGDIPAEPRRFLIQSAPSIADAVLFGAGAEAIRVAFPAAEIDVLAGPENQAIWRMAPGVRGVYVLEDAFLYLLAHQRGDFLASRALLRSLRKRRYDVAINFLGDLAGNWALSQVGARSTIAHDSMGGGFFLSHPVARDFARVRMADVMAEALAPLGIAEVPRPLLVPRERAIAEAIHLLRENRLRERGFLVCAPGASHAAAAWPTRRYAEALNAFAVPRGMPVVYVGSADETAMIDDLVRVTAARSLNFAGLYLDILTALLARAAVYLGSDSGASQIAAATGTPRVTLLPASVAERVGTPGARSVVLVGPDCRPPRMRSSGWEPEPVCTVDVAVREVVDALTAVAGP